MLYAENDSINIERYVKELASVLVDTKATGKMFEEELLVGGSTW